MITYSLVWIYIFILIQRIYEVMVSKRNMKQIHKLGAKEFYPNSFRNIAIMHALYFISLLIESYPWKYILDFRTIFGIFMVITLAGLRLWCMAALSPYWNVKIIVVPGGKVRRRGPYLFMRHPNYLIVALEFIFVPFLMRAPITLVVFSILNVFAMLQRIPLEEKALREFTDYNQTFPSRKETVT